MLLVDDLPRSRATRALSVQGRLQYHDRGSLIDHSAPASTPSAPLTQRALGGDGGQALVDQSHRQAMQRAGQRSSIGADLPGGGTLAARHRAWQADDDLHSVPLRRELSQPRD